jgi:hypothetical protein
VGDGSHRCCSDEAIHGDVVEEVMSVGIVGEEEISIVDLGRSFGRVAV